ncbi:transposase [Candidatus Palauibacter soopunensis]|uniref:RNA-guided endonuclease InsQ/TnpB family protein n=1 Tax=Candidatus Palauibacter soopunensis TaxID=3056739 RepID=UPI00239196B1|nr:transposase [Candidatus Palauibacter soopunensis]MDE0072517.1 transposase [Gammaproteobacteria bacterium]MDE2878840.1 transposase [Candidatus Palauibacter soopunensis]
MTPDDSARAAPAEDRLLGQRETPTTSAAGATGTKPSLRHVGVRVRLYPNRTQAEAMEQCAEALRSLWNLLLAHGIRHHEERGKVMTAKEREVFAGQWNRATGRIYPSNAVYRIAREVGDAYRHWHLGLEAGRKAGLPAFKKRGNPPGIYMHNEVLRFDGSRVRLPRFGWMRWRGGSLPSCRLPGGKRRATRGLLSGRVRMDAGCWMLSCVFECGPLAEAVPAADAVGVALGINDLATICDSRGQVTVVRSEKWLGRAEKRLKRLQRSVARCKRDSNRRAKAKRSMAVLHRRVRHQRLDAIHKATTAIVEAAGHITIEALPIREMMGDPRLAKALANSGLGEFLRQIRYKAEWHGRTVTEVSTSFARSQVCSSCGHRNEDMRGLGNRPFACAKCGYNTGSAVNAAQSLLRYGARYAGTGGHGPERTGRPQSPKPRLRGRSRNRESRRPGRRTRMPESSPLQSSRQGAPKDVGSRDRLPKPDPAQGPPRLVGCPTET